MVTCPSCGYPTVHRDDGSVWCSVYGSHTHVVPQTLAPAPPQSAQIFHFGPRRAALLHRFGKAVG